MRLLTHNIMTCNVGECQTEGKNYPLRIVAEEMEQKEREFSSLFITRMLARLDWSGILSAASDLGFDGMPEEMPENAEDDEEFLRKLHTLLMELDVVKGSLSCPNCSREYPIDKTIVSMVLREDEV